MGEEDRRGLPWEAAFARNVRAVRERKGWSQTELARRLTTRGLSFHQQQVQRIESGARPVRLNEAKLLAELLEADLDEMTSTSDRDNLVRQFHNAWTHLDYQMGDLLSALALKIPNVKNAHRALEQAFVAYGEATRRAGDQLDRHIVEKFGEIEPAALQLEEMGNAIFGSPLEE